MACGSHAAAPAVLTIRRVAYRSPSWSRRYWMCSCRSSSRSGMYAIPARRRIVAPGSCLHTIGHGQHLTAVERNACTQAGSLRHGERLLPGLMQRDMWVMHSPPPLGRVRVELNGFRSRPNIPPTSRLPRLSCGNVKQEYSRPSVGAGCVGAGLEPAPTSISYLLSPISYLLLPPHRHYAASLRPAASIYSRL
jgi:hypothetical protein